MLVLIAQFRCFYFQCIQVSLLLQSQLEVELTGKYISILTEVQNALCYNLVWKIIVKKFIMKFNILTVICFSILTEACLFK